MVGTRTAEKLLLGDAPVAFKYNGMSHYMEL